MLFSYQAIESKTSKEKSGMVEATDKEIAIALLQKRGLVIVSLGAQKKETSFFKLSFGKKVKNKDRVIFLRQLATMIDAGLPIVEALKSLAGEMANQSFKQVLEKVARDIEGGLSFSEALKKHSDVFPEIYINMVRVGESSGEIDKALNELADQQEKDYALLSKIKSALAYPLFILLSLVVVGTIMVIFVMPQLSGLFEDAGENLPFVTELLIGFSNFVKDFWWVVILIMAVLGVGSYYYVRTPNGRSNWDLFKIKVPVIGGMLKKIYVARFSGMLQTLERSGIPIVKALLIAANSIANVHYKKALEKAAKDVENGVPLGTSLARHPHFPLLVIQMIKVGEKTGKLDEVLDKMEGFYRREVDVTAKTFSSLIEPVLMVIIGIVIGIVVASVILPIYNLAGAL